MPISCYLEKSFLLDGRKVNRNRKIFMVAGRQQTWRSQFFLVIKATELVAFITATMKIFLFLSTCKFFNFLPYQFSYGKIWDQGSNFSHEIRESKAAGDPATVKILFFHSLVKTFTLFPFWRTELVMVVYMHKIATNLLCV